jgi:hypothetical protein
MTDFNMDITSANATAVLTIDEVAPNGIQLEGYAMDGGISGDAIDVVESQMGVDGTAAFGYTPAFHPVTITLKANSPSYATLMTLWEAMQVNRKIYPCTLVITSPSLGAAFSYSGGTLKNGTPFPAIAKVHSETTWQFDFAKFEMSKF